jgi:histidinol-phosphatase (PHP family)
MPAVTEHISPKSKHKRDYAGKMKIYTGIEADWYKDHGTYFSRYEELAPKLDFTVGAVHVLFPNEIYLIDGCFEYYESCINEGYGGDVGKMVSDYYETYLQMIEGLKPDLLAHVDLIRKNNYAGKYYDGGAPYIRRYEKSIAEAIRDNGLVTEINGGGNYRYRNDIWYPSDSMLEEFLACEVKMTVGLDAHAADMLTAYHKQSLLKLKSAGFKTVYYYEDGAWLPIAIDDILY